MQTRQALPRRPCLDPDGQEIGISAGRIVSTTYRRRISLAFIGREHADLGTALVVLWGTPGTRQKPIRATVARFPYLTDERNDKIDVEQIPHYAKLGAHCRDCLTRPTDGRYGPARP